MILEVVKECSFDAAHFLPGYDGKCGRIHGHRWIVQIGFKGEVDPKTGMVIDFTKIKRDIEQNIINIVDHTFLNEIVFEEDSSIFSFPRNMPTAENIVGWITRFLEMYVNTEFNQKVSFVRLYESPTSYVEWRKENNVEN